MKAKKQFHISKICARVFSLMLAIMLLFSAFSVSAQSAEKVVRIGWYESPFNIMDDLGRRSGYAYEYAQKVAVYAGWRYEYVEGSWSELMEMLKEGKIDLMSDVSYTTEREDDMLFSTLPMGTEDYYLFTTPDNTDISDSDFSTFNGKKVGVNEGSVQAEHLRDWSKANNIDFQVIELSDTEANNIAKLVRGDIDMYLTLNAIADKDSTIPVCKIASSDFYFAVSKSRPDLLLDLNSAMNSIQDDNRFFNQQLYEKYLETNSDSSYLSNNEIEWLSEHGAIKIGYQDNYLAFCAKDPKTGELIGALKEYLNASSKAFDNAEPEFEPVAYSTAEEALEALKKGEIDCMFPANLTDYYGETNGFSITSSLMDTEMFAIVQESGRDSFFRKERVTVAVNAGNPNYEMFLQDHFPEWRSIYFQNTPECLQAISQGKADCLLLSSFRVNDVSKLCEKYDLVTLNTGVKMDYCIGVKRDNTELYSILNKMICAVPESTMSSALSRYTYNESKKTLSDYLQARPGVVAAIVVPLMVLILLLLLHNSVILRNVRASRKLISATETDELTGLYTKGYFFEYANRLYNDNPDKPMDAVVVNITSFHSVNAIGGRLFGDNVLRSMGEEIYEFVNEAGGIAGHTEADQFVIYCPHLEDSRILFDRLQKKLDSLSTNTSIRLRMGVMPWQEGAEPQHLVEQALIACNLARGLYKENLLVFDENMRQREAFEQQLINDLRRAIDNREFVVYYQSKFDIQKEPPQLHSCEALVRWRHPKFDMITSSEFIPIFERNGQIGIIDNYVWREAAAQAAKWKEKYGALIPISINLSRLDVFDSELENTLDSLFEEYGLESDALELEITESAYAENSEQFIEIISSLRKKGYRIAMDDFGSGYSSLNVLSSMPIDSLKMDKAFMKGFSAESKQRQLVELILDIAKDLKIPVIAEGVENGEQVKLLKQLGCSMAQGYYFSKPLPPEKFETEIIEKS